MAASKALLKDLLDKFLPKLAEVDIDTQREALRKIIIASGFKKFEAAVDTSREPLSYGYNLLLWTNGLSKNVKGAGELKIGKTDREKMMADGVEMEVIEKRMKKRQGYQNNCFGRLSDIGSGHISLSKGTGQNREHPKKYKTWEEAHKDSIDFPHKRNGRVG